MEEPAAIAAAQAVLKKAAAIASAVAPLFPEAAVYIEAFAIADELIAAAIGIIRPETPAEIDEAGKVNPLGMG